MLRLWTACLALLLVPLAAADGKELKPKFGDIDGISFATLPESREACRSAIEERIALCSRNTSFERDADNRDYARCLPVFEWQAESCVAHFRRLAGQCDGEGPAHIDSFTRFGCVVAAASEDSEPAVTPADRAMQTRARAAIRSGPGTGHARIGVLEAGQSVRVTGMAGQWSRIEAPDGGAAFVHASRLVPPAPQQRDPAADLKPKCADMNRGATCWRELADPQGCHFWYDYHNPAVGWVWSGGCQAAVADGSGVLTATSAGGSAELFGAFSSGRMQGMWIIRYADGRIDRGPYLDGRRHGEWRDRHANGRVNEGHYINGLRHGPWVDRYASGSSLEYEYNRGSVDGLPGVYVTGAGERRPGRWSGNCFLDGEGRLLVWRGDRKTCPSG